MDLSHRFTVPTPVEETWAHFQDIAQVAECFPGAQVTEHDEESFQGSVKVKLGPIALQYNGSGTFIEKDEAAHRFVVDAKGKDKRGNGTAGAKVTLTMAPGSGGGTDVSVDTDLAITGKPAQFGRGVMQDVSDKLLGQFVACLEQRLTADAAGAAPAADAAADAASADAASADAASPADAAAADGAPVASAGPAAGPQSVAAPVEEAAEPAPPDPAAAPLPEAGAGAAAQPTPPRPPTPPGNDVIDLGSTVLPILVKSYWRQGLAAVGLLAVVALLRRRRRRRRSD